MINEYPCRKTEETRMMTKIKRDTNEERGGNDYLHGYSKFSFGEDGQSSRNAGSTGQFYID